MTENIKTDEKPKESPKKQPVSRFVEDDFKGVIWDHSEGDGVPIDFTPEGGWKDE